MSSEIAANHQRKGKNAVENVLFSHVQLYVDRVEDLDVYKRLEDELNAFAVKTKSVSSLEEKKQLWKQHSSSTFNEPFVPQNRDVVKQLLAGFGFRVTGVRYGSSTRSVLVTSQDPTGVQILVTAAVHDDAAGNSEEMDPGSSGIFDADKVRRFLGEHNGRQGFGVLAFAVDDVEVVKNRYDRLHPALFASYEELAGGTKVLEVFAFYREHKSKEEERVPDKGTVLRFVQFAGPDKSCCTLGLDKVDAIFDDSSQPAYCDHWVSNVFDRTEFLDTLEDTLGFTPKVDFNAGVVAAGEAQIESTVTGNTSLVEVVDKAAALRDQSQVYLPINNALSPVGHVHGFLNELGQGVQHVASRVEDLVAFVQRGNEYREITGEGFSFLRIPRSYYGVLTSQQLVVGLQGDGSDAVSPECAQNILEHLQTAEVLTKDGALDLNLGKDDVGRILDDSLGESFRDEFASKRGGVLAAILRSRYANLYSLLRDNVSENTYLGIVRNQILVDIQGDDLLYQIFTANIVQRKAGEEAPFFEFIQRVCSDCIIKPGCGGFGIRNFLTLFLSIEVSKAMQEVVDARDAGDNERLEYAQKMVDYFTDQLNESNPILTAISDAMTEEGHCQEKLAECKAQKKFEEAALWEAKMKLAAERKKNGNTKLMECSGRFNNLMKAIREARNKA